jgi:RNA polymerase sigma-70 factor (ECF subfamily)
MAVPAAALTPAQLERLLRDLQPRVRGWLHRMLGPGADLDDACQEALIQLSTALLRFEGRSSLNTFARRVTLRVAYRFFKRRPEFPMAAPPEVIDGIDDEQRTSHRQEIAHLYRCLQKLSDRRRIAFVLCAIEGLTPSQAAELTGATPVAMRSRLLQARRELERWMGGAE